MEQKTFKAIRTGVQLTFLIVPMILCLLYVPYQISQDQHMVDTVNERALNYDGNGTVTDFTDAEIMSSDADLRYEKRAWKLEHKELYTYSALALGIIATALAQIMVGMVFYMILPDFLGLNYDDDEEDYDFEDGPVRCECKTCKEHDAKSEADENEELIQP